MRTSLDLFRLTGRRALITGGGKGLGKVMALALAEAGAEVVVVSRTEADVSLVATEIQNATGQKALGAVCDVTDAASISALAERIGPIDILINNAGINIRGNLAELSEADFDSVIEINVKAPFLVARAFAPAMAARGWGRIVNLGSILSVIGVAGRVPYASSKAAILGMTRVLALEYATSGVTVNALCPGPFATDMNKPLLNDPEKYAAFVAKIPMGRWGELHEITGACLFLASDASSYVTGSTLFVDGGWTAQ
jgi:NAD(P)-dependent dehydrogenase (short-subunit alcohol dehydrogenase family)